MKDIFYAVISIISLIVRIMMSGFLIQQAYTGNYSIEMKVVMYIMSAAMIIFVGKVIKESIELSYIMNMSSDELLEQIYNEENSSYVTLKQFLTSKVKVLNDEGIVRTIKGYFLSYDKNLDEIKTAVYLDNNKLYDMEDLEIIGETTNG